MKTVTVLFDYLRSGELISVLSFNWPKLRWEYWRRRPLMEVEEEKS